MPVCLRCGSLRPKTKWNNHRKTVKSCSKCTKLFPDDAIDDMINEFMR